MARRPGVAGLSWKVAGTPLKLAGGRVSALPYLPHMLKKWLLPGLVVLVLVVLATLFSWWWPWLLKLAGSHSGEIEGLAGLVQIVLWVVAGLVLLARGLRPASPPKPEPTIENLNVSIQAAEAEEFLRKLGVSRPAPDLKEAARVYLEYLVDAYQYLDLRGMGISDRVALKLPLLEMYVPVKARLSTPEGETWARQLRVAGRVLSAEETEAVGERLSEPVPVLALLQKHDGVVLLGDPGAGKTTFLKVLAVALASGQGETLGLGGRLPILLPLAAYANALAAGDVPLDRFIARYYEEDRGIRVPLGDLLTQALDEGRALLLLDGLDEVRDTGRRHLVVDRVRDFYSRHRKSGDGGNRFVLTSRIVGYREVRLATEGLVEGTLVDFEEDEIGSFIGKWTAALEKAAGGETGVSRGRAEEERRELLAAVRSNPGMRSLAANPLLLTILALMKRQGVALPDRRVELYKTYVETLLKSWNLARGLAGRPGRDVDLVDRMKVLAPLALWMHEVSPGVGLVKEGDLLRRLETLCTERGYPDAPRAADEFLEDVRKGSSLLVGRGEHQYGFIHLTFQEYLAAVALAWQARKDRAALVETLAAHIGEAPWHEVVLLTVGYLGIVDQWEEGASEVVEGLLAKAPGPPGEAAIWMGEAVADAGRASVSASCRQKVAAALLETMAAHGRVVSPRRAAAGRALAAVGDPRPEVMTADGMEFRTVPAGSFRMGSEANDLKGFDNERPAHDCLLAYEYRIGRYPVTVAQFREYVDATDTKPEDPDSLRGLANQPVRWVSWPEALAFCRWLEDRWRKNGHLKDGWSVTLPSEAEWEKAARGPDGGRYPWGGNFNPDLANTSEGGVEGVSTVGCFPGGASPYGCEEMSGNAWEWTRSVFKEYPYEAKDGREDTVAVQKLFRVVRGGSCFRNSGRASCTFRGREERFPRQLFRSELEGFRVALLPFSSDL